LNFANVLKCLTHLKIVEILCIRYNCNISVQLVKEVFLTISDNYSWAIDCVSFWLWPVRRSKSRSKVKNFVGGQSHVHKFFMRSKLRVKAVLTVW